MLQCVIVPANPGLGAMGWMEGVQLQLSSLRLRISLSRWVTDTMCHSTDKAATWTESPLMGPECGGWRMGLLSTGLQLWRTSIGVTAPCPATNNLTRLRAEGAASVIHSTFQLKQKVLSKCKLSSSTLDASVSQTYSQKTNNLPFAEIG